MSRAIAVIVGLLTLSATGSCLAPVGLVAGLPVETRFSILNFSTSSYLALGIREHSESNPDAPFGHSPLLPPGGTFRADFREFVGSACPQSLDLQLLIYRRLNEDLPIGLDDGEAVDPVPVVAGEIQDVLACNAEVLETYTLANWETSDGQAKLKLAQCSPVLDPAIRESGIFPNSDAVWELSGVDPDLANRSPPAHAPLAPIVGRVVLTNGTAVQNAGVLLRTRFRQRLDCANPADENDVGYSQPIAFTQTDASGAFRIDRPPGIYRLEFFSDDFLFRPGHLDVETPLDEIVILAEPR